MSALPPKADKQQTPHLGRSCFTSNSDQAGQCGRLQGAREMFNSQVSKGCSAYVAEPLHGVEVAPVPSKKFHDVVIVRKRAVAGYLQLLARLENAYKAKSQDERQAQALALMALADFLVANGKDGLASHIGLIAN
jgi:hypothetical protein